MKEIIYIQAGNFSNYVSTHFWNTQESYFTYEEGDESIANHDISFREGISTQGEPTYCPRALIFDNKRNFGALAKYNELYRDFDEDDHDLGLDLDIDSWPGKTEEHRQDAIVKSDYQQALDRDEDISSEYIPKDVRYWSDFNRVYYAPRTVQYLPDHSDWERNQYDWSFGTDLYRKYDIDHSLMEEDFRHLLEECDLFQGIQMMFDTAFFGSFSIALLESIRDECVKAPVFSSFLLPQYDSSADVDMATNSRVMVYTATCIRALNELASISVPLNTSFTIPFKTGLNVNQESRYQSSALISAHLETATLPSRLKVGNSDLSDLCLQLNWQGNTKISHLNGIAPLFDLKVREDVFVDYSSLFDAKDNLWAQRCVTRGLSKAQLKSTDDYFASIKLERPYATMSHTSAYPLPSSYPPIFSAKESLISPSEIPMISTLCTTSKTVRLFSTHINSIEACLRTKPDIGLDFDELRTLKEDLWTLHDNYESFM